jgi:pimeloyl-ACP methyl ester carboxylesterase
MRDRDTVDAGPRLESFQRATRRAAPAGNAHVVVWGEQDPLGSVSVVQAVTELIPHARLKVLPTGHAPWLGQPAQTAATVADFVR